MSSWLMADAERRELDRGARPVAVYACAVCGQPIYAGDKYYRIDGYPHCEECGDEWVDGMKRIAGVCA